MYGGYDFKNINNGWILLNKKTHKRKRKRKKKIKSELLENISINNLLYN